MENKAHETGTKQLEEQNHNLIVVRAKPVNDAYKSTKTSTEKLADNLQSTNAAPDNGTDPSKLSDI